MPLTPPVPAHGTPWDLAHPVQEAPETDRTPTVRVGPIRPPQLAPDTASTVTPPPSGDLTRSTFSAGSHPGKREPGANPSMPRPGDAFFGFRLVEELGHGTFARVFLAKQESLAGRDVALKVTLKPNREAERLARLQHTNIVPVYSVHTARPMQIICMPYLGRRTIADELTGFRQSHIAAGHSTRKQFATRKGSTAVAGSRSRTRFRATRSPAGQPAPAPGPTADSFVGDVEAVLRLLGQLAAGLAHAHERGVLHLDLKPANVLLADTGEPMLLDFNLSFDATEADREVVGGTIPYMAPEQLHDLRSRGKGKLDARTDLYSLGVMAFEMFTGRHPFPVNSKSLAEFEGLVKTRRKGPPALADENEGVTPAVEAIVRKLLAFDPADRYQSAADLREDVERQLTDRPLRFASDPSITERVNKWRRRNPRTLVAATLAVVLAVAGGAGAYAYTESEKVAAGEAEARARRVRQALDTTRLDLVLPNDTAARERGTKRALELLRQYGLPDDPNWRRHAAFQKLPAAEQPGVAGELGELLLLVAHARWEGGKAADRAGAAHDALLLNRIAEGCFAGASVPPFLSQQRAVLEAAASGMSVTPPDAGKPSTTRDHFLGAVALTTGGKYKAASAALERAVASEPNHGAAQFLLAYCRHHRGLFDRAVERYEAAQALMPADPRPAFYRGRTLGMQGRHDDAEEAFTRAIELDPAGGDVYRNRAIARNEQRKFREAESDLADALDHGASPVQVYLQRISVRDKLGDEEGAAADRKAVAAFKPTTETDFLVRGYIRLPHDPDGAMKDYRAAAEINPRSLQALYQQAYILSDFKHDEEAALRVATRAAELYPEYGPTRVGKALHLARLGRRDEAHREAAECRKLTHDPGVTYRLAVVYAITSKTHPGDRQQAMALLRAAFKAGFHNARAFEAARDLAPLRDLPEFAPLLKAVKELTQ